MVVGRLAIQTSHFWFLNMRQFHIDKPVCPNAMYPWLPEELADVAKGPAL